MQSSSRPVEENGKIRIRFESLSHRLHRINVDIAHKRPESFSLSAEKPDEASGCFLRDELERVKTIDTSPSFKR